MRQDPWIALIGTLDTKGDEIAYTRDRLRALGARPIVIDTGILGEPSGIAPDISWIVGNRAGCDGHPAPHPLASYVEHLADVEHQPDVP